jgi:hypothetical protein
LAPLQESPLPLVAALCPLAIPCIDQTFTRALHLAGFQMQAANTTPSRLGQPAPSPSSAVPPLSPSPSVYQHSRPPYSYPRQQEYPQEKVGSDLYVHSGRLPPTPSPSVVPPHSARLPCPCSSRSTPISSTYSRTASAYSRPRSLLIANLVKPWTPIILYAITTLGFLAAVGFWKAEVFEGTLMSTVALSNVTYCRQPWMSSRVGSNRTNILAMLLSSS